MAIVDFAKNLKLPVSLNHFVKSMFVCNVWNLYYKLGNYPLDFDLARFLS